MSLNIVAPLGLLQVVAETCRSTQYLFQQLHNNKNTIVYKYMTLLHVLAYHIHLQGGGYHKKVWLWLIRDVQA